MRTMSVAEGVAWRVLHNVFTNPSLLVPSLVFPLFFFTAFAGGLSNVANAPGFDFPSGYTAFQFVFVLLQSAAFGGVFTGFAVAADFERGFARRLMLAASNRLGILGGYLLAGLVRALIVGVLLFVLAFAMSTGGPGSMIGFDHARTFNPSHRLSTATGITNVGGFLAALLAILLIGIAMDAQGAGTPDTYTLEAFRLAFLTQVPLWLIGSLFIVIERKRTRIHIGLDEPRTRRRDRGGRGIA